MYYRCTKDLPEAGKKSLVGYRVHQNNIREAIDLNQENTTLLVPYDPMMYSWYLFGGIVTCQ